MALGAVPYAIGTGDHKRSSFMSKTSQVCSCLQSRGGRGELFHAAAQSGLRTKDIADALSLGVSLAGKIVELTLPELGEALGFPPLAEYWAINSQSSRMKARNQLGCKPEHLDH